MKVVDRLWLNLGVHGPPAVGLVVPGGCVSLLLPVDLALAPLVAWLTPFAALGLKLWFLAYFDGSVHHYHCSLVGQKPSACTLLICTPIAGTCDTTVACTNGDPKITRSNSWLNCWCLFTFSNHYLSNDSREYYLPNSLSLFYAVVIPLCVMSFGYI